MLCLIAIYLGILSTSFTVHGSELDPNTAEHLNISVSQTYVIQNETKRIEEKTTDPPPIQIIERSFDSVFNNTTSRPVENKSDNFKPSPHLETIYEYNKAPVVPAMPEAKHISNINFGETGTRSSDGRFTWTGKDWTNTATTEQPWVNRVAFPPSHVPTSKDRPYQFLTSGNSPAVSSSKTFGGFGIPQRSPSDSYVYGNAKPRPDYADLSNPGIDSNRGYGSGSWDKFEKGGVERRPVTHKTQYDYTPPEKSSLMISPIKKIIGLLAAFIPIGLLISALTPSVIQITPINMTQSRNRAENEENTSEKKLLATLNDLHRFNTDEGCEERILCELLLSAGASDHAETHVENLLQAFTETERDAVRKAEELQKVYEAVKQENCKSLFCKTIKRSKKKINTS